jgi:hypothetical protein
MKRAIPLLLLIIVSLEGLAMGIFDAGKVCVFSHVKARLTMNGEPLANAKVIRRWEWQELREEFTTTNDEGKFEFPAIFERSITRFFPSELVISQALYVVVDGHEQEFWSNSKRRPEENGEFKGKPISLTCELTNEGAVTREFGSLMYTLCNWE